LADTQHGPAVEKNSARPILHKMAPRGQAGASDSAPYVVPFAAFFVLLIAAPYLAFLGIWEYPLRVAVLLAILFVFSRDVIDLRVRSWGASVALGVAVFALWVAPDMLIPGYRSHWLFQNAVTGGLASSVASEHRAELMVLVFRTVRAVILVPIIEELFWRAWITAVLFASEHGPYWDVGLITGFLYNWWMIRTRSLGDCFLTHAVTNACLCVYVIVTKRWEYWM
jgi:membrane protease YdiL (CAAX protease family)